MSGKKEKVNHCQSLLDIITDKPKHKFLNNLEIDYEKSSQTFAIFNSKFSFFLSYRMTFDQMVYYLAGFEKSLELIDMERAKKKKTNK
jgi:hypothetical protein